VGNLNRRLDYLKQGTPPPQVFSPKLSERQHPHCPSPLARDRRLDDNAEENRNRWSPLVMPRRGLQELDRMKQCFTPSPSDFRRPSATVDNMVRGTSGDAARRQDGEYQSPQLSQRNTDASPASTPGRGRRGPPPVPPPRTVTAPKPAADLPPAKAPEPRACKPFQLNLNALPGKGSPKGWSNKGWSPKGWTAIEASSSDSDGSLTPRPCQDRRAKSTATTPTSSRPPLVTYKSVDHRLDCIDVCPQSEPVKRKVYAGSHTLDRLSKKLENTEIMPSKHFKSICKR
jgi:hypothetical protein